MEHDHAFFATLTCPTNVTWSGNVKQLFTSTDVDHMKAVSGGNIDLSSYTSVKMWASAIYNRVASGSMPPPGSGEGRWSSDMVNTFGCWIQQGCPQ
jgi:hypothetical protein